MPDARPNPDESPDEEGAEDAPLLEGDALDLEALKLRGDIEGVLELAKAYRAGKSGVSRDMKKCLEAYKVAAELGSSDGDYAVALFHLTGGVIPQDLKEGATRLRAAAEKGSVPAKVYLGNLYELGIHYKQDKEKADVWYKSAARGAQVDADPGTEDYRQELAELGCVRYFLELSQAGALDDADKARLLARAKAHGYQLKMREDRASLLPAASVDRPTLNAALDANEIPSALSEKVRLASTPPGAPDVAPAKTDRKAAAEAKPAGPTQAELALGAFGYALLFVLAGTGAGYAATHGARALVENGTKLPGLGTHVEYVFPIVLFVFGLLPAGLAYQRTAWLKGLVAGAAMGGVGWVAWGTGVAAFHASRFYQAITFGLAGFLAALLVLGLLGGTKKKPPRAKRRPA